MCQHAEFDAAVFGPIGFRIVRCDGPRVAIAGRFDARGGDAALRQEFDDGVCPLLGELKVCIFGADRVGVTRDLDFDRGATVGDISNTLQKASLPVSSSALLALK